MNGAGKLGVNSGAGISSMNGNIGVATLEFVDGHNANILATEYDAPTMNIRQSVAGTNNAFTSEAGTYTFPGNTNFSDSNASSFTVTNSANNPNFVFKSSVSITEIAGPVIWIPGTGTIAFSTNTGRQTVNFKGKSVDSLISSNTASAGLIFSSSFTTPGFTLNASALASAATIYFCGNSTFTISTFTMTGDASHLVVLKSTSSAQWYLNNVNLNSASYVYVSSSNAQATGGKTIFCANCIDGGNNLGWVFLMDTGVRYWVASSAGNWSDANNWSLASGGPGGYAAPTSTMTAVFDGGGGENGNTNIDVAVNVASMSVIGSYSGIVNTQNNSITIGTGGFNMSTGTFAMGTSTETIAGNFSKSGGTFDAGVSTIQFTGAGSTLLTAGGTSFYNLIINKTGGNAVTLGGDLIANGNLTIQAGTMTAVGALQIYIGGKWNSSGGLFNYGQSTVTFNGTGSYTILSGGASFYNVNFNNSASTFTQSDTLNTIGGFQLNGGTFTPKNFALNVGSDWIINGGIFLASGSVVAVSRNVYVNSALVCFQSNTSEVKLLGSGTIANAANANGFFKLTQGNGVTTTVQTNLLIGGNSSNGFAIGLFTTGDGTSVIQDDNAGPLRSISISRGNFVNNGVVWNNRNSLAIGLSDNGFVHLFPGGNYGTVKIVFADSSAGSGLSGNVTTGGSFQNYFNSGTPTFSQIHTFGYTLNVSTFESGPFNVNTSSYTNDFDTSTVLISSAFIMDAGGALNNVNADSATIVVGGNWFNNFGVFSPGISTVTFAASSVGQTVYQRGQSFATVIASNTSSNGLTFNSSFTATQFICNTSGLNSAATNYFAGNSTFTISTFTVTGAPGKYVVLKSTSSAQWYLNDTNINSASYVYVSSSNAQATGGKTIFCSNCIDGGNNLGWNFGASVTDTWTGASDTNWSNAGNWDQGIAPRSVDAAVIPSVATLPLLTAAVSISTLTINSGASVNLNGFNLTLSSFTNAGNFIFVGTETVTSAPNSLAGSTVTYQTSSTVAANVLSTWTYVNLVFNSSLATYSLIGPISTTENLTITTGTVQTAQGIASTITVSGNMLVDTGAILTVRYSSAPTNGGGGTGQLISAATLTINANGQISANSQGFGSAQGPGYASASAGASYGGMGGPGSIAAPITYGSLTNPTSLGSNIGGGAIIISLTGACTINGTVGANGQNQNSAVAGSGGTVNIAASTFSGSGVVRVNGGAGIGSYSSGGGRIAVVLTSGNSFGSVAFQALGGSAGSNAAAGTIYQQKASQGAGLGDMILNNNGTVSGGTTEISTACTNTSIGTLTLTNSAVVGVDANVSLAIQGAGTTLNINSGTALLSTGAVTLGGTTFINSGTWTNYAGSTVTYIGQSDNSTVTISATTNYSSLGVNKSGTTFNLLTRISPMGNLTITNGTLNTTASTNTITLGGSLSNADTFVLNGATMSVGGNWANTGTFTAGSGSTITFTGAAPTLAGNTTFYNMKYAIAGGTMTFANGSTQTVSNLLTLTGASGNSLFVRSSTPNNLWSLKNSGTNNVTYVDAKDSDARLGTTITDTTGGVNSGNNFNWRFNASQTYTWWGTQDTNWTNANNWDVGVVPGSSDGALIVSTATFMPVLTSNVSISTLTINSGAALTLNGFNLALSSLTNAGSFNFQGTEQVSTVPFNLSGSTVTYSNTAGTTAILSTWTYRNLTINGSGGTFSSPATLNVNETLTISSGTFSQGGSTITAANYTQTGGTFSGGTSSVTINGVYALSGGNFTSTVSTLTVTSTFTVTGSPTFIHNSGFVVFNLNNTTSTITTNGITFNNLTLTSAELINQLVTTTFADSFTVAGNLTVQKTAGSGTHTWSATSPITITDQGNFTQSLINSGDSLIFGNSNVILNMTGANRSFTLGAVPATFSATFNANVNFNGTGSTSISGGVGPIASNGTATVNQTSGSAVLTGNSTFYLLVISSNSNSSNSLDVSAGNYDLWLSSGFINNAGSGGLNTRSGTVYFNFTRITATVTTGGIAFNNLFLTIGGEGSSTFTTTFADNFTVTGNLTVQKTAGSGVHNWSASNPITITEQGNFTESQNITAGVAFGNSNLTLQMTGSGSQTMAMTNMPTFSALLNINKSGGSAALISPFTVTTASCTVAGGTFDLNGSSITCGGGLQVFNGANFQLQGGEPAFTAPTLFAGSTVTYDGMAGPYTLKNYSYSNLTINGVGTAFNLNNPISPTGNLTITNGTLNTTASTNTITLSGNLSSADTFVLNGATMSHAGNWTNTGTFTPGTSTVTFNGSRIQTLSGSTTFYALRALTSGATLQFTNGTTQYATNMVDFENVGLLSTSANATWYFALSGSSQTLKNLRVQDSNATGGNVMNANDGTSTNLGNNTNWNFASPCGQTVSSAQTGVWSSPSTWVGNTIPSACNPVTIVAGSTVTVDTTVAVSSAMAVNGTLKFSRVTSSTLTMVGGDLNVNPGGTLDMGTSSTDAIPSSVKATLLLAYGSTGGQFGLIVNNGGNFVVYGATKTPFTAATQDIPQSGHNDYVTLAVDPVASGWQVGDSITVGPGNNVNGTSTVEQKTIIGFPGSNQIQVDSNLTQNHYSTWTIQVADLTRNVLVRSSGTSVTTNNAYVRTLTQNATSFNINYGEFAYLGANASISKNRRDSGRKFSGRQHQFLDGTKRKLWDLF